MTAPPSIVEFLDARLAVVEANAHRIHDIGLCPKSQSTYYTKVACTCDEQARARRGVEAKRRLIDTVMAWEHQSLYSGYDENIGPFPCSRDGAECDPVMCGVGEKQDQVLRALAAEFAGHEDYQKEPWAL